MYSVSNAYKAAIKQPAIRTKVDGKIGNTLFSDDNILAGSFTITNQNSDNDSLKIGTVYTAELKITLRGINLTRYSLNGKKIIPDFYLKIPTGWEKVPLGEYYVSEANHTAAGVEITAYDVVSKLDKKFSAGTYTGTPYALATTACSQCGVTLLTTSAQFAAFANGTETLSFWADGSDVETWRDFISWVAQACCCYVTASRDGKIVFRPYNQTVVDTVDTDERFKGASYSDYETRYTGLYVTSMIDNIMYYYGQTVDDALTYNCGANPFLQYGSEADRLRIRRAVLNGLSDVDYVPFAAELPENPAYDLGDVVKFPNGLADGTKLFCINKYTWSYHKSIALEGVGENPNLASARSKTDKNISGLMSQVVETTAAVADLTVTMEQVEARVDGVEGTVATVTLAVDGLTTRVEDAEGNITTLQQTTTEISGEVSNKADKNAGTISTFAYSLTSSGFTLSSNSNTVMSVTASGATIAGWGINASKIYHTFTSGSNDGVGMVYSGGAQRPSLWNTGVNSPVVFYAGAKDNNPYPDLSGDCYFGVLQDGSLYCQALKATGGTIGGVQITPTALNVISGTDVLFSAGGSTVKIAGFTADKNSLFSGDTFSSSDVFLCTGSTGTMTIAGHSGTNWALKAGSAFGVDKYGNMYATSAHITGAIEATSGHIGSSNISRFTIMSNAMFGYTTIYCGGTGDLPGHGGLGSYSNIVYMGTNGLAYSEDTSGENWNTVIRAGTFISYGNSGPVGSDKNAAIGIFPANMVFSYTGSTDAGSVTITGTLYQKAKITVESDCAHMYGTWKTASAISVSSDRNAKHDIEDLTEKYDALIDHLRPVRFKYNDGQSDRYHTGFVAQEVKEAMDEAGLDTKDFAAYVSSLEEDEQLSLRYEEFIALNTREIQKLKQKIKQLEQLVGGRS